MSKAAYNPPIGLLDKYQLAAQVGDYNGLFDANPTLQAIFDIEEKGLAFFDSGPGVFTRASQATRWNAQGNMETVAIDTPRIDYDPLTGKCKGLLVEDQRTNLFLNSMNLGTQSVTSLTSQYTVSFYGTGSITFSGAFIGVLNGTGSKEKVEITFTPSAGSVICTIAGNVDYANFEPGTYSTSWIPTTDSSATRSPDNASVTGALFSAFFNQNKGTILCNYGLIEPQTDSIQHYGYQIDDGSNDNRVVDYYEYAGINADELKRRLVVIKNGIVSPNIFEENLVPGIRLSITIYNGIDYEYILDKKYDGTINENLSGINLVSLKLGSRSDNTRYLNGHIKRFVYFPSNISLKNATKL